MRRRLFTILSALSLILCLATATIWVRSYWQAQGVLLRSQSGTNRWHVLLGCIEGTVIFGAQTVKLPPQPGAGSSERTWEWKWGVRMSSNIHFPKGSWWHRRGFLWESTSGTFLTSSAGWLETWTLFVPGWLVTLLAATLPALWLRQPRRRRFREQHGLCLTCGYDLRATLDRCPECGTPIAPPADSPQSGTA